MCTRMDLQGYSDRFYRPQCSLYGTQEQNVVHNPIQIDVYVFPTCTVFPRYNETANRGLVQRYIMCVIKEDHCT